MYLYDIFSGPDLKIAEKIQHRRLQMLVHSYLYYELDSNIVSDAQWSKWGKELQQLQDEYPKISSIVNWSDEFKDWDGSTGAFLPLHDDWVIGKANSLTGVRVRVVTDAPKSVSNKKSEPIKNNTHKLF